MQARLQDVNNLVKLKNPSLLLQINQPTKAPAERGGGGGGGSSAGGGRVGGKRDA
jgi:hypothetical protein